MRQAIVLGLMMFTLKAGIANAEGCASPTSSCPDVARLLEKREGYGQKATGGLGGVFVTVTSDADSGPGTLRDALAPGGPARWIRFAPDITITLKSQVRVPSNVTIDGRGSNVRIQDFGLSILGAKNVIVTHLTVDGRLKTFGQAINIANNSRDVWANHLDLSRFNDRLMNVKNGSTDVTVSWVKFHAHNKVMLINNLPGANLFVNYARDSKARVTLHSNWFVDTVQRNPRAMMATIHLYNNLVENWDFYGMNFSLEAKVLLEGNMYSNTPQRPCKEPEAFKTTHQVERNYCHLIERSPTSAVNPNGETEEKTYRENAGRFGYTMHDWRAFIRPVDNMGLGAVTLDVPPYQPEKVPSPSYCYSYALPSAGLAQRIRAHAGVKGDAPPLPRKCPG